MGAQARRDTVQNPMEKKPLKIGCSGIKKTGFERKKDIKVVGKSRREKKHTTGERKWEKEEKRKAE